MSSIVSVSMISGLEGRVGSNPMVLKIHPPTQDYSEDMVIAKALPHGAEPDQFYIDHMDTRKILVYTFDVPQEEGRSDLGSIGLVVGKDTIVENLQQVVKALICELKAADLLTFQVLKENLDRIINGINKQCKIKIGSFKFDVAAELKKNQIQLQQASRKAKGMF